MSLAGCQINQIDVNFHLQKSLEIFDTNSADKIQSQNYKEVKVPCLMPIRVKVTKYRVEGKTLAVLAWLRLLSNNFTASIFKQSFA